DFLRGVRRVHGRDCGVRFMGILPMIRSNRYRKGAARWSRLSAFAVGRAHFAYPCDLSQSMNRLPCSQSSTSTLPLSPLGLGTWVVRHDLPVVLCNSPP